MIFPVGNGTRQDFEDKWYVANSFGHPETYGFHEGADINLKTGGDTDLGQELKAIANGKLLYYHYSSHPTTNFGRHLVYRIEGAWGTRWIHYAHCLDTGFLNSVQDVTEGQVIAKLGKSGTGYAHLHMAIYKVDPATAGGIDNIANTATELNQYWEDPITFLNTWTATAPVPVPPPVTDQSKYDFGDGFGIMELQAARSTMQAQKTLIGGQKQKLVDGATALRNLANGFES